ncbi:MAG: MspA family porin [Gordonia sp. (in: high G+C Gram-positive bacteria)]
MDVSPNTDIADYVPLRWTSWDRAHNLPLPEPVMLVKISSGSCEGYLMVIFVRRGMVAGAFLAVAIPGIVSGTAAASPGAFADHTVTRTTAEGWQVSARKLDEKVSTVHPLDNSPNTTKEAFLSLRGVGEIAGSGTSPVIAGTVRVGFQIACGGHLDSGTVGISAGPTAQMSISYPPAVVIGAQAMGNISANLRPGTIEMIDFGTKQLRGKSAGIEMDRIKVRVTGCISTVAVRAVVTMAIATSENDTTVNSYGKAHVL